MCDLHRNLNYLGIQIFHIRIKRDPSVLSSRLRFSGLSIWKLGETSPNPDLSLEPDILWGNLTNLSGSRIFLEKVLDRQERPYETKSVYLEAAPKLMLQLFKYLDPKRVSTPDPN